MPPTTDRKELLRRAILREAIINRDPITVEDSADARVVTDDLLRRKVCDVRPATGARLVTMTAQPNEAQEDGMRVSRQTLLWLEDEGDISESELTERLKTAFPVASIRRGIARMKLLSLIEVTTGRVIDRTGDGLRPETRDPATIGELVSLITGEAPILPEPDPTRPQGEDADASEPTRPQGEEADTSEPETTEDEPDTAAAPAQPAAPVVNLVTRDDMTPDEIIAAFEARYLTPELSDTSMTYLAGIVKKVHEEGGYLLTGGELWHFMDQQMGGALLDFVRCLVARGVLHRTADERGVPAFTVEERFLLPEQPVDDAPADTASTDDAPADEPVENLRLVLTDEMTPEQTEAKFREVYAYDEESTLRASETIHRIIGAAVETNGKLAVDSTEWRELDETLDGVLWDYIRALSADGTFTSRVNAFGRILFEYTPRAPEPEQPEPAQPEDSRAAAKRERLASESLEGVEQAQREADIAAGVVEPTPPPAPKKRGLSDLIERRLDTLDHKVNKIGELVHKVYDIHQRTSVSVEAQLLRDADPFVVEVLKTMAVHLHTAPGNMLTPGALHRKLSATPKAGGPSPRDCYDLAFDLGDGVNVLEVVDGGRRVRLVDTRLLMTQTELTRRLSRSENYRKGRVTAWTTRKARALLDA